MTRETKIGLLVGLGFIVVFAVLLSHTGTVPPAGDGLPVVTNQQKEGELALGDGPADPDEITRSSAKDGITNLLDSSSPELLEAPQSKDNTLVKDLPRPQELEQPSDGSNELAVNQEKITAELPFGSNKPAVVQVPRVAPKLSEPVDEPQPTPRPVTPTETAKPEPAKKAPPKKPSLPKDYTVQKGDVVGVITTKFYGTSKPEVVEFFVKANKGQIKDKNTIVVGQKLLIPDLPPDLFEPATNVSVAKLADKITLTKIDDLVNSGTQTDSKRQAPTPIKPDGDTRTKDKVAAEAKTGQTFRWYEIKPKDTYISISRKELGEAKYWTEIKKLNKHVEPTKMLPGTKIKLPLWQPETRALTSRETSA